MNYSINNPFRQLYVGESVGPEEFVKLFSPILVETSLAMFQPGNLVVKGFTGAGKSMLLNLLDPSIRIAYNKLNVPFPIPKEYSKFIGAGINLQTSGVSHFGNRPIESDYKTSPFFFGDFLNYYIVADILNNLIDIIKCSDVSKAIGIHANLDKLNEFALKTSNDDCWFGYLKDVKNIDELCNKLKNRIIEYKSYLNFNNESLPKDIIVSKTIIGKPISVTANILKEVGIINDDVQIFIKIDQYEELVWLGAKHELGGLYKDMIHTLLGSRDSAVSYRIGTRHFAWAEEKTMFGTTAPLEKKRNYLEFHLDNELRRKENRRLWVFPDLAEDIFKRRLIHNEYLSNVKNKDVLKKVFNSTVNPQKSALQYFANNKGRAVELEKTWPKKWNDFLLHLAATDPFNARLAEAWARQRGKENIMYNIPLQSPYPWEKIYWKKERTEQALMQLASRNNQQLNWSGKEDVLALSGGNILAFLSISQHIWDVWLRDSRHLSSKEKKLPTFDGIIQSVGIIEASNDWFNELAIDERGGKVRKKLITFLGVLFFKTLIQDKAMSNPGHNGFSIDLEELENYPLVSTFLKECVDYGDLYDSPHTSKLKDKRKRWKYYLNPILSPYFKIPYVHTKEPIYVSMEKLINWLNDANINLGNSKIANSSRSRKKNNSTNNTGNGTLTFDF